MTEEDFIVPNQIWKSNKSPEKLIIKSHICAGLWDCMNAKNKRIVQIQESDLRSNWKLTGKKRRNEDAF